MFKQLILPIIGVAIFIVFVGVLIKNPAKLGFQGVVSPIPEITQKQIKVGESQVKVTIASTSEKRTKGLSGVTSLGESEGMLFVFDSNDVTPTFWMKDMKIGLDIIWINDDKVVQIDKSLPPPAEGTPDSELKLFKPSTKVDYVLEVNAGFSDKNGLKVGDEVSIPQ